MLSVIIPTLNGERTLVRVLAALVPAAVDGLVCEVIVADGGSGDATLEIAEAAGCGIVRTTRGRGNQLAEGARAARGRWLLFLHADTVPGEGWIDDVRRFIEHAEHGARAQAAAFRFALDAPGTKARLLEWIVAARCATVALPYGDQGLLLSRQLYDSLGGFRPIPLMEDVDLVRRIGRHRLALLSSRAVTSSERYQRGGFVHRMARNVACLTLFFLRVPPRLIVRLYG